MQNTQKDFHKKLLGRSGEIRAVKFLKKRGYKILAKNFTTKIGEIDIICEKCGVICFTEVKTRSNEEFGAPSEAVGKNKRAKYYKVAEEFLIRNGSEGCDCRFDVIEVEGKEINLIENAFGI